MPPSLQDLWAAGASSRHPYALVNPVIDGRQVCRDGADREDRAAAIQPVTAALLQIAAGDLQAETDDGSDEVKANTSAEAMDIAATRIDAKSAIYLDNMKQSVQREGEIYLGMAPECYFEDGRIVETMSEDGDDGEATLKESFTDSQGVHRVRNDFSSGRYKVIADVTEATATRRDKTVKSMLATAQIAMEAGDQELAQASILTAVMNQDGEGSASIQKYARKKLVVMGIEEPNEAEKAEMEQAQQQPDPTQQLAAAEAALKAAQAKKAEADAMQSMAGAGLKVAQAHAIGWPGTGSRCPRWAGGRAQGRAHPQGCRRGRSPGDADRSLAREAGNRGPQCRDQPHEGAGRPCQEVLRGG
jgi:hypothetical protein